jgi:hypothetical protein
MLRFVAVLLLYFTGIQDERPIFVFPRVCCTVCCTVSARPCCIVPFGTEIANTIMLGNKLMKKYSQKSEKLPVKAELQMCLMLYILYMNLHTVPTVCFEHLKALCTSNLVYWGLAWGWLGSWSSTYSESRATTTSGLPVTAVHQQLLIHQQHQEANNSREATTARKPTTAGRPTIAGTGP